MASGEKRWINVFSNSTSTNLSTTNSAQIWTRVIDYIFCALLEQLKVNLYEIEFYTGYKERQKWENERNLNQCFGFWV